MPKLQAERHPWTFNQMVKDNDAKAVRAAEYSAQFLDRIELQLDRIATALEKLADRAP